MVDRPRSRCNNCAIPGRGTPRFRRSKEMEIPESVLMWQFGGKPGNISSQNHYANYTGYNMFCRANNKYLTWKEVPLGINLDYITDPEIKRIHFRLPDNQEREILTGEPFALGIGGGEAFLGYHHRTVGINLEWYENPKDKYQWKMFGADGELRKPIASDSVVAISNQAVEPAPDFFIYLDRKVPGTADVGWTTSPEFWDQVLDEAQKVGVTAVKGWLLTLL
jgi:hypothetical protein